MLDNGEGNVNLWDGKNMSIILDEDNLCSCLLVCGYWVVKK